MTTGIINPKSCFTNKYGVFMHRDMVGKPYGHKLQDSKGGKAWLYLLHPTPELWTTVLPHRTQILYLADISLISAELDLRPGSSIIEAGTGSGSFSHALCRTIAPTGKLYTFEFHQQRTEIAKREFDAHGLSDVAVIQCRDVCANGFGLESDVNAVFLDLPCPWEAIPHTISAFRKEGAGRICCFSPCIEQVQRTCDVLRAHRFIEIKTVECLLRNLDVRTITIPRLTDSIGPLQNKKRKIESSAEDENNNDSKPFVPADIRAIIRPHATTRGHTSFLTFATYISE